MKETEFTTYYIVDNVAHNEVVKQTQKSNNKNIGNIKYIIIILYQNINTHIKEYISENKVSIDRMSGTNGIVFPITDNENLSANPKYDYSNLGKRINGFIPEDGQPADIYQNDLYKTVFSDFPCIILIDTKTKNTHTCKIDPNDTKEQIGTKFAYMFDILNEKDFKSAIILLSLKNIWEDCKEISLATVSGIISILISLWKP